MQTLRDKEEEELIKKAIEESMKLEQESVSTCVYLVACQRKKEESESGKAPQTVVPDPPKLPVLAPIPEKQAHPPIEPFVPPTVEEAKPSVTKEEEK